MDTPAHHDAARRWLTWVEASAEALAQRLRQGQVPKLRRPEARTLLAEAFATLASKEEAEEDAAGVPAEDAATPTQLRTLRRLAQTLDRLATPPVRPIPNAPMRSVLRFRGAVDGRQVNRIIGYWEWAEALVARQANFLETAGFEAPARAIREVVEGNPPEQDRVLTEG